KNALRSSGSAAVARTKTLEYFDLTDLKLDDAGNVISFKVADTQSFPQGMTIADINARNRQLWEPDKSGSAGDQAPPTEARYNEGNRAWVATLPAGSYELETDGDLVRLNRTSEQGGHEFVLALPS